MREKKAVSAGKSFKCFCFRCYETVDLLILAPYRERTISVTKRLSQITHLNRTLFTVPLILN